MLQINKRIKKARLDKGYTQQEMADKLNKKRSTYAEWERSTEPKGSDLKNIAEILELNMEELLTGNPSNSTINTGMSNHEASQRIFEMVLANNALTKVLKTEIVALKSSVTGKSISSVNLQIEKDAADQLAHDLKEYEKYSG